MATVGQFLLAFARLLFFVLPQRLESALLRREQELGQRLVAQRGVDEKNDEQGKDDGENVNQAAQGFPARASRIIKDWFGHGGMKVHRMPRAAHGTFIPPW